MEIVYRDNKIVVCIKPNGVLSTDEPGGLPSLVRETLGEGSTVYTVHRLDAAVGGIMVLARTRHAASTLGKAMAGHELQKEYLAVVHGDPGERGTLRDFLTRDTSARMTCVCEEASPDAREAVLDYERLETAEGMSLVRIRLHTGRTHQIRCQFASRGWPLWGDRKYGHGEEGAIALWSCALSFAHPATGEPLHFEALPGTAFPWSLFQKTGSGEPE